MFQWRKKHKNSYESNINIDASEQENNKNINDKPSDKDKKNPEKLPASIDQVKQMLNLEFSLCSDFTIREILIGQLDTKVLIAMIDGFYDKKILSENIIEPIMKYSGEGNKHSITNLLKEQIICSGELKEIMTLKDSISGILSGDVIIFIDGQESALKIGLRAPEKRAVSEADTEVTLKGSREGFSESLRTNIILLRRRIKNTKFKVETIVLGEKTNTDVSICYIQGIASNHVIDEVRRRINKIKIDGVLATGYIEQFIQDSRFPLFPIIGNSEKPDKVAAKILEGRVAILSDGTPTVLTVPYFLIESIQAQEDYFGEFFFASFMRILRLIAVMISIYLPAIYVALTNFHQTIIPYKMMLTMAASREGIPFSAFIEALFMLLTFEILREAGQRMPRAIGQAVSIVGAIVLGDAAVSASIASAPLVIIIALAGICSFIVPPLMKTGAILRVLMLMFSGLLGLMGIGFLTFLLVIFLCKKKSFGAPYLSPISPFNAQDLKDSLIVVPVWAMFTRPKSLAAGQDIRRTTGKNQKPRRKRNG